MDQMMIDITGVENPQIGDEIVLAGTQQEETISLAEVGEFAGTSDTEYICRQGQRLPKVYLEGGRVVDSLLSETDLAPTLLDIMGIEKPAEMTGESMIVR